MSLERALLYDGAHVHIEFRCAPNFSQLRWMSAAPKMRQGGKNQRSTHGNIYPRSYQLNICLTLSYLHRNHSNNTKDMQDMTWRNLSKNTISGERSVLIPRRASWKIRVCFKRIKAITCTFLQSQIDLFKHESPRSSRPLLLTSLWEA